MGKAAKSEAAAGMWESGLGAQGGAKTVENSLWRSPPTADHFYNRPSGRARLVSPGGRTLRGGSTHGKQRRTKSGYRDRATQSYFTFNRLFRNGGISHLHVGILSFGRSTRDLGQKYADGFPRRVHPAVGRKRSAVAISAFR